ncbi:hypothetical protein SLS58_008583 [Diplodia intermedia]|uniref:DUF6536 domain-containing protein n=1 Tax=Diplodia intermedia TaxID=856260 RepID=A0ABR3THB4_9PEZI
MLRDRGGVTSFAPLLIGDCKEVKRLGVWIHLAINVLSSLVLGGSNYCLQCLSAPTREEVDKAHAEGSWLHIGVPNIRNLRRSRKSKACIWAVLGLSSIPFHLLYNSTFYTSTVTHAYDIYFASPDFAAGAPFDEDLFPAPSAPYTNVTIRLPDGTVTSTWNVRSYQTDPREIRRLAMKGAAADDGPFERLTRDECIRSYANTLLTDRRNLILVAAADPLSANTTFMGGLEYLAPNGYMLAPPASAPLVSCDAAQPSQAVLTPSLGFVSCAGAANSSSLYAVRPWERPLADNWYADYFQWICYRGGADRTQAIVWEDFDDEGWASNCTTAAAWKARLGSTTDAPWTVAGFDVEYCLSERVPEECRLNVALPLLLAVVACNLLKLAAVVAAVWAIEGDPLITIGDAVASFVKERDETTLGMCLWSWEEVVRRRRGGDGRGPNVVGGDGPGGGTELGVLGRYAPVQSAMPFEAVKKRRREAVGKVRWAFAGFLSMAAFATVLGLFGYAIHSLRRRGSARSIRDIGIGQLSPETLITGWNVATTGSQAIVQTALVANLPQLLLSFIYFVLNSLFTSMSLAAEWNRFGQRSRGLRVSVPRGPAQRSTYFLHIPYRLGVPLLLLSVALHWMVSQSIFFVQVVGKNSVGKWFQLDHLTESDQITTCAYSPLAMLVTLVILVVMLGFAVALGFRRLHPGIPMAGSCSLAISAACHVPKGTSEILAVKWGAVADESAVYGDGVGHCAFSNGEVESPVVGRMYA